jgi:hypothetical protein
MDIKKSCFKEEGEMKRYIKMIYKRNSYKDETHKIQILESLRQAVTTIL